MRTSFKPNSVAQLFNDQKRLLSSDRDPRRRIDFYNSCIFTFDLSLPSLIARNHVIRAKFAGSEATVDEDGAVSLSLPPFSLVDTFLNVLGGGSGKRGSAAEDGSLSSVRSRGCNRASSRPYSDDQTVSGLFCMYLHHDWPLLLPSGH